MKGTTMEKLSRRAARENAFLAAFAATFDDIVGCEEAVEEMRHLEEIGGLLVSFGVPPVFTACPPYPVGYYSASNVDHSKPYVQMLEADIRGEREAIALYTRILGSVSDERVRETVTKIRADEERHLALLRQMRASL